MDWYFWAGVHPTHTYPLMYNGSLLGSSNSASHCVDERWKSCSLLVLQRLSLQFWCEKCMNYSQAPHTVYSVVCRITLWHSVSTDPHFRHPLVTMCTSLLSQWMHSHCLCISEPFLTILSGIPFRSFRSKCLSFSSFTATTRPYLGTESLNPLSNSQCLNFCVCGVAAGPPLDRDTGTTASCCRNSITMLSTASSRFWKHTHIESLPRNTCRNIFEDQIQNFVMMLILLLQKNGSISLCLFLWIGWSCIESVRFVDPETTRMSLKW